MDDAPVAPGLVAPVPMDSSTSDVGPPDFPKVPDIAGAPLRSMSSTFRGIATLVGPTSLVVALLYYFGWARTQAQARAMGLDDSLFGFSTQDYVLRSVSPMFWPVFLGTVAVLVGLMFHRALTAWVRGSGPAPARAKHRARVLWTVVGVAATLAAVFLVLGAVGANVRSPSRLVSLGSPLAVTVGVVLLGYAGYVFQTLVARPRDDADPPIIGPLAWSAMSALLLLSLFWTVSHYAAIRGIDFAGEVERTLPRQPDVAVYSAERLHLMPPVQETELPGDDAAYRYVYTDLKLLFRSDAKLFLRPSDVSSDRNIILPESSDIRVEFSR
jgi:hypothetical protein